MLRSNFFDCGNAKGAATLTSNWSAWIIRSRRAAIGRCAPLLLVLALAGFGAAYLPATGSSAAPATTTVPKPDPYPTTTRSTPPPAPTTTYVAPAPAPPPPPPATTSAAASPPPPPPPPPRASALTRPKSARHRTRTHEPDPGGAFAAWRTHQAARRVVAAPDRPRLAAAAAPAAPAPTTDELRLPGGMLLLLVGFALVLATAVVAVVPMRALPSRLGAAVDGRRELLELAGMCALGLGIALTLLVAFAWS